MNENDLDDGAPKFGRLLAVLLLAVAFVGVLAFASERWLA